MEVIGGVSAVTTILEQLLKTCLAGYRLFTTAQNVGKRFENYLYRLEVSRQKLEDWSSEVQNQGRGLQNLIDPRSYRYRLILQTLARIAGTFAEVEQLKREYGIINVKEISGADNFHAKLAIDDHNLASTSAVAPSRREGFLRALKSVVRNKSPAPSVRTPSHRRDEAKPPSDSTQLLILHTITTDDVPDPTDIEENDLNRIVPDLDRWLEDVKDQAARYQQMIPTLARYKWACIGQEEPLHLVENLEVYVRYLESLTKYPLKRLKPAHMLAPPPLFNDFKVQWQLPYPRLDNFCGRESVLEEMDDLFIGIKDEKSSSRRRAVVLQGMGGLGKSQIALEYIYRHPEAYAAVFWVDATDQSTIRDSGRQILQSLIVHYSTKHHGKHSFADVATDLGIPGQIKNDGTLADEVAKATWPPIRSCRRNECTEDEQRMNELLPASDHGHVIVTSRVPVANLKPIDIPYMGELSSLKLLLRDTFETASSENREAAKAAAAYVAKRSLDFIQYLKRLMKNKITSISQKFSKYTLGVVSCWQLSAEALMNSKKTHSLDLLRLCSFLSPEGVSKELLVRGLSAMEWFDNDESQLDDAIDYLVVYALMKRKRSTNAEDDETYWIHPLVRDWARDMDYDGKSVTLETDETRLWRLHNNGYLQAIALVGCSLNTRYDNRDEYEWNFERRNMTHISLCRDTYIHECRSALALCNFAGFDHYWDNPHASATHAELSIKLYKKLIPADPPRDLEAEMLLAMQRLMSVHINRLGRVTDRSLMAGELDLEGRQDEALDQYRQCLENIEMALDPGMRKNSINMATVHNLACFYEKIGDQKNALKLYDHSVKLYLKHRGPNHQDTHIVLDNIARVMGRSGRIEEELEYLKVVARGSEATYGLANWATIVALYRLRSWYQQRGPSSEADAEAVAKKINEGEKILADCNRTRM
ncbi:hypothetical protein HD806DRAFT_525190 [Xylariaceae sp. AK1471]|nr:hypothetical protein HD806DRAFT_525190 [Xylariaceae sp. AK1471]